MLGAAGLRLEQLPGAVDRLRIAEKILDTAGLGVEVFLLYAHPKTRLEGVARALEALERGKGTSTDLLSQLQDQFNDHRKGENMTKRQGAIIRLGEMAADIQKAPGARASANEEQMTLRTAMEAATEAWRLGQCDRESVVHAVAGELEETLVRRNLAAAREHRGGRSLREACLAFAETFADEFWFGVCGGRPVAQRAYRGIRAIYRSAYLGAIRARGREGNVADAAEAESIHAKA